MKKLFVSMGLAAAGTASLYAYGLESGQSKVWTVAATLRGFYDDNYLTVHSPKQSSLGFEVSPSFSLHAPLQQTEIGLKYVYGLYYYQKREEHHQNPIDQTHQFDLWLDHAFTPRWETRFEDTFTVAQNPELLTPNTVATAQRVNGNNIANTVNASLHTVWTRDFSTVLSYQNTFYRYDNRGSSGSGLFLVPSYAGLLDRIEQTAGLEGQWEISPNTSVLAGYQFGIVNFIANEAIAYDPITLKTYYSNSRDNWSQYGYIGVQHQFLENLSGSARAGVQYTKYYNDPAATTALGPYADASLVYTYAPGSYFQLGFTESRNATDAVRVDSSGHITQDQESSVVYASINQPLTSKMTGSLVGHYQHSIYHEGFYGNQASDFYNLGVNLNYAFTRNFSSEVGYNFDYYTSPDTSTSYTRNRIYMGVTASY